jgi:uncharacterized protein YbjT (DUF2867 family)
MEPGIVTVFGGSGFVGRQVVQALARTGARIRVVCRRIEEALPCRTMGDVGQVVPVVGNIRDSASIAAAVEGADTVVNLVGILYERGRQTFDAVHRDGAAAIAREAARAGVRRLIHVSAIGADPDADAAYARSKGEGEAAVREAFPEAVILRPSIIFGPEDGFFSLFAAMARLSPVLPLIGGGHTRFQPVYVGDVAAAVARSMENSSAAGRTFELGGPRTYSFRELLELMLRAIDRRRLLIPVPFWLARAKAAWIELCLALPAMIVPSITPPPPITRDQVRLLRRDNVVSEDTDNLRTLGIEPEGLEAKLPAYLVRYRRNGGNFSRASGEAA